MIRPLIAALMLPATASAGDLVAARTLAAGTVISAADLREVPGDTATLADPGALIGKAVRHAIYEGRAIRPADLREATLVARNQLVTLTYQHAALSISTEGRALSAGAAGEVIAVMNLRSRATVQARVKPDGTLSVLRN